MQRGFKRGHRGGFTLLELMAVLAILAVTALMVYPSFEAWTQRQQLRDSVEEFRNDLIRARTMAMNEGRPYRCTWDTGGGSYRIAPDEIEFWPELAGSAIGPSISSSSNVTGASVERDMPEGISFVGASANPLAAEAGKRTDAGMSGGGEYIVFEPDGTATILLPDGTEPPQIDIFLASPREERVLRLRAVTSVMTVFNPNSP